MATVPYSRLELILEAAKASTDNRSALSQIEDIQFYSGYAEPGYTDPASGWIAIGNWNTVTHYEKESNSFPVDDDTMPRIAALLERLGVELEWLDEWMSCECGKLIRTSPDGYGWTPSYWIGDGFCLCHECVTADPSDYLESLEGNPRNAMTIPIDLAEHDYVLLESGFENGLHSGQDADPKVIAKSLKELGIERFIFTLDSVGRFDMDFSVWIHKDEMTTLTPDRMRQWEQLPKDGPSVSLAMQSALRDASAKMAQLPDDGIKVATCKMDGTADVRVLTPQEFLDGKAGHIED